MNSLIPSLNGKPISGKDLFKMFQESLPSGEVTLSEAASILARSEEFLMVLSSAEVYVKLLRGAYLHHAIEKRGDRKDRYGSSAMKEIVQEASDLFGKEISMTIAYEEKATYERIMLNYDNDLVELFRFIRDCESDGYKVYWSTIRNNFTVDVPPEQLYGSRDGADEVTAKKIERLGHEVESAIKTGANDDAFVAGIETLVSTRQRLSDHDDTPTYQNKKYQAWLGKQGCFLTGVLNEPGSDRVVDVAHIWSAVMGAKESILVAIPMAHKLHLELHATGINTFSKKHGHLTGDDEINWYRVAFNYIHKYITGGFYDLHSNEPELTHVEESRVRRSTDIQPVD